MTFHCPLQGVGDWKCHKPCEKRAGEICGDAHGPFPECTCEIGFYCKDQVCVGCKWSTQLQESGHVSVEACTQACDHNQHHDL